MDRACDLLEGDAGIGAYVAYANTRECEYPEEYTYHHAFCSIKAAKLREDVTVMYAWLHKVDDDVDTFDYMALMKQCGCALQKDGEAVLRAAVVHHFATLWERIPMPIQALMKEYGVAPSVVEDYLHIQTEIATRTMAVVWKREKASAASAPASESSAAADNNDSWFDTMEELNTFDAQLFGSVCDMCGPILFPRRKSTTGSADKNDDCYYYHHPSNTIRRGFVLFMNAMQIANIVIDQRTDRERGQLWIPRPFVARAQDLFAACGDVFMHQATDLLYQGGASSTHPAMPFLRSLQRIYEHFRATHTNTTTSS